MLLDCKRHRWLRQRLTGASSLSRERPHGADYESGELHPEAPRHQASDCEDSRDHRTLPFLAPALGLASSRK